MSAENFDSSDGFHFHVGAVLEEVDFRGLIVAIVWSVFDKTPGYKTGMVITQSQMAMSSRRFSVTHTKEEYTLKFLGKTRKVKENYFSE